MKKIETLTPVQLSFLLGSTKEKAMSFFLKVRAIPQAFLFDESKGPVSKSKKNARYRKWELPIEDLSKAAGINLSFIVSDIQKNFAKNETCIAYSANHVAKKIKKNDLGFYPKIINIPREVQVFMDEEQRAEVCEKIISYLPLSERELIKKHNIRIL